MLLIHLELCCLKCLVVLTFPAVGSHLFFPKPFPTHLSSKCPVLLFPALRVAPYMDANVVCRMAAPAPLEALEGVWRLCFCEGDFIPGMEMDKHGYIHRCVALLVIVYEYILVGNLGKLPFYLQFLCCVFLCVHVCVLFVTTNMSIRLDSCRACYIVS